MRITDERPTHERNLVAATKIRRGTTMLASRTRAERLGELSLNQVAILGWLAKTGLMTPGEVAQRLRTQPQSITRTLAGLEAARLVSRTPDPDDGRQSLLTITASGRRALAAEMAPRDVWLAEAISQVLTSSERELLVLASELMERLAELDAASAVVEA